MFLEEIKKEIEQIDNQIKREAARERYKSVVRVYKGEDEVISSHDLVEDIKQRGEEDKVLTGWSDFDKIIQGFRKRQLVAVSAGTKSGKTTWCIDLTSKIKDRKPLWFPFEEGGDELVQKYVDRNEDPPLFFLPKSNRTNDLEWLEKKIIESIAKYGTEIVFIDHLEFLVPFSENRHDLRMAETMRHLKHLAKKWDIIIFVIAHIKKARIDAPPTIEDIRGSASIAQEADTVLMLWRETSKESNGDVVITDNVNLSVQANRRTGKTGNVKMKFDNGRFLEQEWRSQEEEQVEEYHNIKF